ncbi:hypothetical protein N0B40_07730 [Chryseobacterium oranimense]|uniref:hypothetical protein n=1 Tax=Chryseobacterium oranimense TaxID=421058 RepID=UPI0021AF2CF2|nr:hypothetical protein [Chryseobacterium oranimense]UWX62171.1 hypothetical protein N0B40_07730 [Chryseobacterium oranimense]
MVALSSFYLKIYKAILILIILFNLIGILALKFFLPEEKAKTYDLTVSTMLIIICGIFLIICFGLANVSFDKNNKTINIKRFNKAFIVNSHEVIKVERFFIFFCKITYAVGKSQKSFTFLSSFREFFPLSDYPQKINALIRGSLSNR